MVLQILPNYFSADYNAQPNSICHRGKDYSSSLVRKRFRWDAGEITQFVTDLQKQLIRFQLEGSAKADFNQLFQRGPSVRWCLYLRLSNTHRPLSAKGNILRNMAQ